MTSEHLVLEFLQAHMLLSSLHFWRDTSGREIDFVIPFGRDRVDAIECKWAPERFDGRSLEAFRKTYPKGKNYVLSPISGEAYLKEVRGKEIVVCHPSGFLRVALNTKRER